MSAVDGVAQAWEKKEIVINLIIWIVIIILIVILCLKTKYKDKIMRYIAYYVIAIQMVALLVAFTSYGSISKKNKQLVVDNMFEVSKNDNVIVFLLDAYDQQFLQMVLEV